MTSGDGSPMSPAPKEPLDEIKERLESASNGTSLTELQKETVSLLKEVKDLLAEIKILLT